MPFRPEEILFSPTANCSLSCPHCDNIKSKTVLSKSAAKKFLRECKKIGIDRVGFTGGEPFLALDFVCALAKTAVSESFLFDRIMTNAVWYKNIRHLKVSLARLYWSGYDGEICVSVDAFHRQDPKKIARFIETAQSIWRRPDIISIVYVRGRDRATKEKLLKLAKLLKGKGLLSGFGGSHPHIRNFRQKISSSGIFSSRGRLNVPYCIKIGKIDLSPIGKARRLKNPWNGRWFKEDYCKGPGNIFFITPSGDVKPCCGYANTLKTFIIGNIKKDSPEKLLNNFSKNRAVYAIFNSGLSTLRKALEKLGVIFPGKTSNHCYFCRYILTKVPARMLRRCLG